MVLTLLFTCHFLIISLVVTRLDLLYDIGVITHDCSNVMVKCKYVVFIITHHNGVYIIKTGV